MKKVDETEAELGDPALDELLTPYLHQQLCGALGLTPFDPAAHTALTAENFRCV